MCVGVFVYMHNNNNTYQSETQPSWCNKHIDCSSVINFYSPQDIAMKSALLAAKFIKTKNKQGEKC